MLLVAMSVQATLNASAAVCIYKIRVPESLHDSYFWQCHILKMVCREGAEWIRLWWHDNKCSTPSFIFLDFCMSVLVQVVRQWQYILNCSLNTSQNPSELLFVFSSCTASETFVVWSNIVDFFMQKQWQSSSLIGMTQRVSMEPLQEWACHSVILFPSNSN